MDFAVDCGKIDAARKFCTDTADNFKNYIDTINNTMDGMGEYWSGDDYEAFKNSRDKYKVSVDKLVETLNDFATTLDKVNEPKEELANKIRQIITSLK